MLIDLKRCVGCMSCIVACKMEHSVPPGIAWNKVETAGPVGTFPDDLSLYFLPHGCMHCERALCVEACPTGASYVSEDGLVLIDPDACLGCDYCVTACPYSARSIDQATNLAVKCNMCVELLQEGERPSCVKHCMAYARIFGDMDEPGNPIEQYLSEGDNASRIVPLLQDKGTGPKVIYLAPKCGMLAQEVPMELTKGL
jgi:Fe-S-cluster-containing dehydrogenase component